MKQKYISSSLAVQTYNTVILPLFLVKSLTFISFWTYRRSAAACESSSWSGLWHESHRPSSCNSVWRSPTAFPLRPQTHQLLPPAGVTQNKTYSLSLCLSAKLKILKNVIPFLTFSGATSSSSAMGEVEAMVLRSTPWIWKDRDILLTFWYVVRIFL